MGTKFLGIVIAALGGAAVGIDRQRAYGDEELGAIGGLRTFTLLGTIAGLCGYFLLTGLSAAAIVILAACVAVLAIVRLSAGKIPRDATTEVAAVAVLVFGVAAGYGHLRLAAALYAWTVLILIEKSWLHTLVSRIGGVELRATVQFLAMALIVFPVLPHGSYGPYGVINPRIIWILVLAFSGLAFAGYLARKMFGEKSGWILTGTIGGLISSTQVAVSFSRESHEHVDATNALVGGVMAATVVSLLRVLSIAWLINSSLARLVLPCFIAPCLIGVLIALYGFRASKNTGRIVDKKNPLQFLTAVQLALLFIVVQYVVTLAHRWFGHAGLLGSAALIGSTDIDALLASFPPLFAQGIHAKEIARVLIVGVVANTAIKPATTLLYGRNAFRIKATAGLLLIIAALLAGFVFLKG
ncbi:MAG: MgtC/SapB family protein [Acidobacteriaceae bacterium]